MPKFCGNGIRCFLKFLIDIGYDKNTYYKVEIANDIIEGKANEKEVCVHLTNIKNFKVFPKICLFNNKIDAYFVEVGVPHLVVFSHKKDNYFSLGKALRYHDLFRPTGVNVNFVEKKNSSNVFVSTYERGVEAITMACGSGGAAVAYVMSVLFPGTKEILTSFEGGNLKFFLHGPFIQMIGPAQRVFSGEFEYNHIAFSTINL